MREWLRTASITPDKALKADLTGPMEKPNSAGTIYLEGKKELKARGLASPDSADALAVTFAFPVASRQAREDKTKRTVYADNHIATSWMGC
jgi:phage terminase large subunit